MSDQNLDEYAEKMLNFIIRMKEEENIEHLMIADVDLYFFSNGYAKEENVAALEMLIKTEKIDILNKKEIYLLDR